jgi:hypothetical protein
VFPPLYSQLLPHHRYLELLLSPWKNPRQIPRSHPNNNVGKDMMRIQQNLKNLPSSASWKLVSWEAPFPFSQLLSWEGHVSFSASLPHPLPHHR